MRPLIRSATLSIALQTMSFPRPIVKVCSEVECQGGFLQRRLGGRTYHAVTGVLGISLQDTVCCGIVASSVHSIRASLVEGGWESHIACVPTDDCNFCHAVMMLWGLNMYELV